jgi:flavin-dependent dehydrogenase
MEHEEYGELHMGTPGYFALAPVDSDLVNINFVVDKTAALSAKGDVEGFYRRHLEANPRLAPRLKGATLVGKVRATGPMARRCGGTVAPGALLIGDAAEFVDPFTGEGLYIAMRSAELAAPVIAEALAAGRVDRRVLDRFHTVRTDEFAEKYRMCWLIQKHLYTPWLANYVVRRLAANPDLADTLAAVTGDYVPPASVVGWRFYWSLFNPFAGRRTAHAAG